MLEVYRTASGFLASLVVFSFLILSSSSVFATCTTDSNTGVVTCNESAGAAVTVTAACTLTATTNSPHVATVIPGTYDNGSGNGIGQTTISVACNDPNGYAIYAIGYSDKTYGNNNLVGDNSGITIATGTATSGSTSNWSMKLVTGTNAPILDNGYNNFSSVPSTYTRIAHKTAGTGASVSTFSTTYAVFITGDQAADVYNGKVKYTMVHPFSSTDENKAPEPLASNLCKKNNICYAPNSYDIVGSMDSISTTKITSSPTAGVQTNIPTNATVNLAVPNYSRTGYGFAGWSTDFDAEATYKAGENPTIYGPNETITTSTSGTGDANVSSKGLILYPVWIKSTGTIQSWTGCSSLTTAPTTTKATLSTITALTDIRDGNVYTVARLADDKCWMAENLRLNAEYSTDASLAQGYYSYSGSGTDYGSFIGLATSENTNFSNTTNANSIYYSDSQLGSAIINIGTASGPGYRMPRYNNNNTDRTLEPDRSTLGYSWFAYGNYYNWPAAIASSQPYTSQNTSATATSICPAGWRIPVGGGNANEANNEYWNLIAMKINGGVKPANYDSTGQMSYTGSAGEALSKAIRAFPNNYYAAGYLAGTSSGNRDSAGHYWTSTASLGSNAFELYMGATWVYPGVSAVNRYIGRSVRCLTD